MPQKKGFTLIEILVALMIVAILAAVAVPKITGSTAKAQATEIPMAADAYMTMQTLYAGEHSSVGSWKSIGYAAPESAGGVFEFSGGDLSGDVNLGLLSGGAIGWAASNTKKLNSCPPGNTWSVTVFPESENSVRFQKAVARDDCESLIVGWTKTAP